MSEKAEEGNQNVDGEKSHPETVPWTQYVGLKEKFSKAEERFTKTEQEFKNKVATLEEQIKKTVSAEEVSKLQKQLDEAKETATKAQENLKKLEDASLSEKKAALVKKGIPETDIKDLSEKEVTALIKVVENLPLKPKPDMSGGGGGVPIKGSPMELARQAYSQSKKQ